MVAYSLSMYSFSADVSCSRSLLVTFLSAARTIPSLDKIPIAVPACDIASNAYSTWYNRPSGENIVVCNAQVNCNAKEQGRDRARADLPSNHTFSTFLSINNGLNLMKV